MNDRFGCCYHDNVIGGFYRFLWYLNLSKNTNQSTIAWSQNRIACVKMCFTLAIKFNRHTGLCSLCTLGTTNLMLFLHVFTTFITTLHLQHLTFTDNCGVWSCTIRWQKHCHKKHTSKVYMGNMSVAYFGGHFYFEHIYEIIQALTLSKARGLHMLRLQPI